MKQSHLCAILYALAGYSLWVGGDSFMKLADEMLIPKYEIMVFAGLSGLAAIFAAAAWNKDLDKLRPRYKRPLLLLGFLFLLNYGVWLTALQYLPLANFYAVIFLAPTVGTLVAAFYLKEKLNLQKLLAIIAGFIGVVIAVNPAHVASDAKSLFSYGAACAGMVIIVVQMMTMRSVGDRLSREAIAFYPRLAAIAGGLVGMCIWGFVPLSTTGYLYCIGTGVVGGMGWLLMAHAYKMAPASTIAPFHYSQIITGGLMGYLIWHNVPTPHLLMGAAVIIASGLYLVTHARKTAQLSKALVDQP